VIRINVKLFLLNITGIIFDNICTYNNVFNINNNPFRPGRCIQIKKNKIYKSINLDLKDTRPLYNHILYFCIHTTIQYNILC